MKHSPYKTNNRTIYFSYRCKREETSEFSLAQEEREVGRKRRRRRVGKKRGEKWTDVRSSGSSVADRFAKRTNRSVAITMICLCKRSGQVTGVVAYVERKMGEAISWPCKAKLVRPKLTTFSVTLRDRKRKREKKERVKTKTVSSVNLYCKQ